MYICMCVCVRLEICIPECTCAWMHACIMVCITSVENVGSIHVDPNTPVVHHHLTMQNECMPSSSGFLSNLSRPASPLPSPSFSVACSNSALVYDEASPRSVILIRSIEEKSKHCLCFSFGIHLFIQPITEFGGCSFFLLFFLFIPVGNWCMLSPFFFASNLIMCKRIETMNKFMKKGQNPNSITPKCYKHLHNHLFIYLFIYYFMNFFAVGRLWFAACF